jgi:two-component system cell cycle sensor histidine kinase/response regulator CckA
MKPVEVRPLTGAPGDQEPLGAEPSYESLRAEVRVLREKVRSLEAERREDGQKLALLSSLLQNLPAFVLRVDSDHRITFVNRTVAGLALSDVVGKCLFDFVDPHWVSRVRGHVERALAERAVVNYRTVGVGEGTPTAHYESIVVPIDEPDGSLGYCLIALDVSRQVERERAFEESEAKLRLAVESTNLGIFSWDSATDVVEWNSLMYEITGEDEPLSPAQYLKRLVHPGDRQLIDEQMRAAARGEPISQVVHRIVRRDGEMRWLLTVGARSITQGERAWVVGGLLDITQQRQFDERLRKAQRMDAIGNLTAGVAHNFNNMLAAILPVLELFRSAAPESLVPYVEHAEQAGARAAELVRQLMTFAGQRGPSAPTAQAPEDIVRRALSICRHTFDSRIELVESIEGGLKEVFCDQGMVEQVLVNLILNARDALLEAKTKSPRIEVLASRVDITDPPAQSSLKPGSYARFRVCDNGPGIEEGVRAHLFEPFVTTKSPGHGTGLGLAVSQAMVRERAGDVVLDVSDSRGTSFSAYLPERKRSHSERPSLGTPSPNRARVLVLDDEEPVRLVVYHLLTSAGYQVETAGSEQEALRVLERSPCDVVLLDRSIPGRQPIELVQNLRRASPRSKVLYFTGQPVSTDELAVVDGLLQKPISQEELTRAIERCRGRV